MNNIGLFKNRKTGALEAFEDNGGIIHYSGDLCFIGTYTKGTTPDDYEELKKENALLKVEIKSLNKNMDTLINVIKRMGQNG